MKTRETSELLARIAAWIGAPPPATSERPWILVSPGEQRLPVSLHWSADVGPAWTVALGDWDHEFADPTGEDEAELEALLAAALFGQCRVCVISRSMRPIGGRIDFVGPAGWKTHASWGQRPWWRRSEHQLWNQIPAPFPLSSGLGLPRAPWIGMLSASAAPAPIEIPLDGELDLHTYAPAEVGRLVVAYVDACRTAGVVHLRIVHGKGRGQLRRTVHAALRRHPAVLRYRLGSVGEGSWGATLVDLRPPSSPSIDDRGGER